MQIDYEKIKDTKNLVAYNITATKNTWSHQRRKRREERKLSQLLNENDNKQEALRHSVQSSSADTSMEVDGERATQNGQKATCTCKNSTGRTTTPDLENALNMLAEVKVNSPTGTKRELEEDDSDYYYHHKRTKTVVGECTCHVGGIYLKALLVVRREDNADICIEVSWLEGTENREVLHQILQYIKNNLKLSCD